MNNKSELHNLPLWAPSEERVDSSRLTAFCSWLSEHKQLTFERYDDLWQWSVEDIGGFWSAIWEYYDILATRGYDRILADDHMPGAKWFEGAELNLVKPNFPSSSPGNTCDPLRQ